MKEATPTFGWNNRVLPRVDTPKYIVFTDFDESYFAHEQTDSTKAALAELETFLRRHAETGDLLFGIITGSNLATVYRKLEANGLAFIPHFVGGSMGTEIVYFDDTRRAEMDDCYAEYFSDCAFTEDILRGVIDTLVGAFERFEIQPTAYHARLKRSCYYYSEGEVDEVNLALLRKAINDAGLHVSVNQCNPNAGDPVGAYDVDILPKRAGKQSVVQHLIKTYGVDRKRTWGFGDSGNDLQMLEEVGHGWCLANATDEARAVVKYVTERPYAAGILEVLEQELRL